MNIIRTSFYSHQNDFITLTGQSFGTDRDQKQFCLRAAPGEALSPTSQVTCLLLLLFLSVEEKAGQKKLIKLYGFYAHNAWSLSMTPSVTKSTATLTAAALCVYRFVFAKYRADRFRW